MSVQTLGNAAESQSQDKPRFLEAGSSIVTNLVCDNALLRSGLQHILSGTRFSVAENSLSRDAVAQDVIPAPGLYILAVGPDLDRICDIVKQVKGRFPEARVVALADHFDADFMIKAIDAGVDGFCLTATDREVLIKSLELVMLGEAVLPSKLVRSVMCRPSPAQQPQVSRVPIKLKLSGPSAHKLSAREVEILGCLMDGAPNKVIARKLDVAEATIKVHVKAILRKIGAVNRTQAAMWATEHLPSEGGPTLRA